MKSILLKHVSVFDGKDNKIAENQSMLVREGKIAEISSKPSLPAGEEVQTIDCERMTVLPGLIDLHVHLSLDAEFPFEEALQESKEMTLFKIVKNGKRTLEGGVTTVRDLGCRDHLDFTYREAVRRGIVPGPRMLLSGKVITKTGGHGYFLGREADGEAEIMKAVREQVKAGADVVKVMSTGGVMTKGVEPGLALYTFEEVKAAAEEAKRSRKLTASHAQGTEGIKDAVLAGIDTIEHGIYITEEIITLMIERGTYWVPTLTPGNRLSHPRVNELMPKYAYDKACRNLATHRENFAKFCHREGLKLGLGSDAGPPFVFHGDIVTEMQIFTEYGFSNFDALKLATYGNAGVLRMQDRIGALEVGMEADLIGVRGNPLEQLSVLREPKLVMKEGVIWCRRAE
jgi:imidazolonepropionase-like amidohydrolase